MSSKPTKLALSLLATSALAVTGFDLYAQRAASVEIARLVAAHPGLSVARIDASPLLGRVTLTGIDAGSGDLRVSIGRLQLPLTGPVLGLIGSAEASPFDDNADKPAEKSEEPAKPEAAPEPAEPVTPPAPPATAEAPAAPAPAASGAPGSASADNVVITDGTSTYRIKRVDLAGTNLSNADLAAILDPKSDASVSDRLKRLTAATIAIPELSGDNVAGGVEQHFTEHNILLASVVAGRATAITASGATFATKSADDVVNGTLGTIVASGVDMPQLVRVFGTKRTDDSEPQVPLLDAVTISGGSFTNITKNSTISIGPINETGLAGRPLKVDPTAAAGGDKTKANEIVADLLQSITLKSFDAKGLAFKSGENKDTFGLAGLSMQGFGSGKIDGFSVTDFNFDGDGSKIAIGGVQLTSFTLPGSKAGTTGKTTSPFVSKMDVTNVAVDATQASDKPDVAPTHFKFALKHFGASGDPSANGTPQSGSMAFEALTFALPPGSAAGALNEMGYAKADVSGGASSNYDSAALTLGVKDLSLDSVGMGRIGISLDLTNVAPAVFSSDTAASKVAALAMLIKGFDLNLKNAGLIEKAIAWKAKSDGLTPSQERDQAVDLVTTKIPVSLGNGKNAKAIGAAVGKFLTDPRTLHISAASKTGLGAGDMALIGTPDVLIESLDVKATADE